MPRAACPPVRTLGTHRPTQPPARCAKSSHGTHGRTSSPWHSLSAWTLRRSWTQEDSLRSPFAASSDFSLQARIPVGLSRSIMTVRFDCFGRQPANAKRKRLSRSSRSRAEKRFADRSMRLVGGGEMIIKPMIISPPTRRVSSRHPKNSKPYAAAPVSMADLSPWNTKTVYVPAFCAMDRDS